ncbi:XdhC family protein [Roseospira marina]|uniref:XdhC family protein n=1 Tax=Roseospira marina TaxID=140057 RepID=A0A5M6I9N7_9PROT|nr:XdhC family protein [Roseospira marina]KAA5604950.1 XdhC family protein [Roseospira marina]MBB4315052.1 xanthine dehydrogenase accessory factor [Roseospira marina]MBB5088052.1 xanthine dehydrogenase accessory factor [Roseospira marina]
MIQDFDENVLPALLAARRRDGAGALVTLVRKTASGPRPLGAQLAVSAQGHVVGLISGGCVEGGIAEEALAAMAEGRNRVARFGEGSRYVDLRMPCGGSIDVYVDVTVPTDALAVVADAVAARRAAVLVTDTATGDTRVEAPTAGDDAAFATTELAWTSETQFRRLHRAPPRLILAGRGPILPLCAQIAALNGYRVEVLTDDAHAGDGSAPHCAAPVRGTGPGEARSVAIDSATAVVTLFHDHAVELPLLRHALGSPAFHIGALGSQTTHAARLATLADEGFDETTLARIEGPAGVPIHAANPAEIATSIVAGVIRAYRSQRPSVEAVRAVSIPS